MIFNNQSVPGKDTVLKSVITFVATLLLMMVAASGIFAFYQAFNDILLNPLYNPLFYAFFILLNSWLAFSGVIYLSKLYLYLKDKTKQVVEDENLPSVTAVVSANNEGKHVYNTLISLAKSDYPEHKLQILAIGNTNSDDTWSWIHEAKNDLGDRVSIYQSKEKVENQDLNAVINNATGNVIVNVGIGAVINEDTLRNLIIKNIVSGKKITTENNIKIINKDNNTISNSNLKGVNLLQKIVINTSKRLHLYLLNIEKKANNALDYSAKVQLK
ncbi:glycosyltransferase (GT2) [Formosa agariphila KMM 3901]|uniref:Glycosyltransferase (GT2) n=2 Tax=Formosa TaxID=225842 RepID=T2KG72_FORAG|nr:glycosyltransferase (GT2) [Formosa agariphila KMM 3901]